LLTGVLRVAKSGYLSGLNNLRVYSLLDERFSTTFGGVTEEEVIDALDFENLLFEKEAVEEFYNGYTTPGTQGKIYNPWSIANFLDFKDLRSYWADTGSPYFFDKTMWSASTFVKEKVNALLKKNIVEVPFMTNIAYHLIRSEKTIWSLLYFSGYLTGTLSEDGDILNARIPNKEVKLELCGIWERGMEEKGLEKFHSELLDALVSGDDTSKQISEIVTNLVR